LAGSSRAKSGQNSRLHEKKHIKYLLHEP
jgi:hypothetical protein